MMDILCTGGTGYVGTWMDKTKPDNVTFIMQNHEHYLTNWEAGQWDYIVHLAPISPWRVMDYAQKHKIKVLFASSGAVYEGKEEYADNKRAWEVRCNQSRADVVIARLFATSGLPFQKNKALSIFIQNALKGEPLQIWGDGCTVRSYLYGEDVGNAFWDLLFHGYGTFDVGSIVPYTMLEVAQMVNKLIPSKIEFIEHEEMPTPVKYFPTKEGVDWGCPDTIDLEIAIQNMIKGV